MESLSIFEVKFVDFMDKKFWYKLEYELFLNWKVVLSVIVENFESFDNFWVQTDFFKKCVTNLVIFDHAENRDLVNACKENFGFEISVLVKLSYELISFRLKFFKKLFRCLFLCL